MEKRLFYWELAGALFTAAMGTLLHFVYDWSGGWGAAAAFSAVNESTWEHMKLLFFPMFLFSVVQVCCLGRNYPNFLAARGVSTVTGVALIPVLFYTYTGVLGRHLLWADIAVLYLSVLGAFALDFRLLRRGLHLSLAADPGPAGAVGAGVPLRLLHVPSAGAGAMAGPGDAGLWAPQMKAGAPLSRGAPLCFRGFSVPAVDRLSPAGYNIVKSDLGRLKRMKTTRQKRAAPFYAAAAVWLAYALVLPLYEPLHYALAAGASLLAFAAAAALCRGGPVGEEAGKAPPEKAEEPVEKKPASTGNPELDKMVRDGEMAIREMKRLDDSIAVPGISADIVRLEQVSARIFDEVRTHPEKLPQIRRFLDYYLPTTLKLLNAYDRMSGTGVSGENIDTTLAKVEGMMRTIVAAFEKQLDSLYGAEALDISTDITVLENMMAREGLVDSPLKAEPDEKKETDIRLEL